MNEAGDAVFAEHYQFEDERILYGIQFDVDSSRIVGLSIPRTMGRTDTSAEEEESEWTYKLGILEISEPLTNQVELNFSEKDLVDRDAQPLANKEYFTGSKEFLVFTGKLRLSRAK